MTRLKKVTEEVARWVFEVHLREVPEWSVAFTNPTAGPWKRVMARDAQGSMGEVHRFLREDTRPDLVLVSDVHAAVVIVEAKTRLGQLASPAQAQKTVAVVDRMGRLLRSLNSNRYWRDRTEYQILCGLLWGAETPAALASRTELARIHSGLLPREPWMCRSILGIECLRERDQANVRCTGRLDWPPAEQDAWANAVVASLRLDVSE